MYYKQYHGRTINKHLCYFKTTGGEIVSPQLYAHHMCKWNSVGGRRQMSE